MDIQDRLRHVFMTKLYLLVSNRAEGNTITFGPGGIGLEVLNKMRLTRDIIG
jgi:hypothetical protein